MKTILIICLVVGGYILYKAGAITVNTEQSKEVLKTSVTKVIDILK